MGLTVLVLKCVTSLVPIEINLQDTLTLPLFVGWKVTIDWSKKNKLTGIFKVEVLSSPFRLEFIGRSREEQEVRKFI